MTPTCRVRSSVLAAHTPSRQLPSHAVTYRYVPCSILGARRLASSARAVQSGLDVRLRLQLGEIEMTARRVSVCVSCFVIGAAGFILFRQAQQLVVYWFAGCLAHLGVSAGLGYICRFVQLKLQSAQQLAISSSHHSSSISGQLFTLRGSSDDTNLASRSSAGGPSCQGDGAACHASGEGAPTRVSTRSDGVARAEGWRNSAAKVSPRRVIAELSPPGLAGDEEDALEIEIDGNIEIQLPAEAAARMSSSGGRKKSPHASSSRAGSGGGGSSGGSSGMLPELVAQHPLVVSIRRSFSSSSASSGTVRPMDAREESHSPLVQKGEPSEGHGEKRDEEQGETHDGVDHGGEQGSELGGVRDMSMVISRV